LLNEKRLGLVIIYLSVAFEQISSINNALSALLAY